VREHLDFRAAIKGVRGKLRAPELARVAERTGLRHMLETPIQQLSRGYRQRVGIADALLGAPPLVVLDEPTVGLDPNQVLEIRAMLRALGGTQTLIFSSHILAEVEALCDRVVILARGRCVADEAVSRGAAQQRRVVAEWVGDGCRGWRRPGPWPRRWRPALAGKAEATRASRWARSSAGGSRSAQVTCPNVQVAEALMRWRSGG
jgi:energy-coupling factor transporter ATP-binding protein EcfA2